MNLGAVLLTWLLAGGVTVRRGPGRTRCDSRAVPAAVADAGYNARLETP